MYLTLMRVSRILNNEPLDQIAQAVRVSKSRISTLERFPHGTISPRSRRFSGKYAERRSPMHALSHATFSCASAIV